MKITIEQAITSLCPTSSFVIKDGDFDNVEWLSDKSKPSKQEVDAEVIKLQAEYDAKEYQRKRVAEYPSYADQFDTIFHDGINAWKAQIQAVKDKYPKGTA